MGSNLLKPSALIGALGLYSSFVYGQIQSDIRKPDSEINRTVNSEPGSDSYQEIYTAVRDRAPFMDFNVGYRSGVSNPFNYSHGAELALRVYFLERFYGQVGYTKHLGGLNNFTGDARADLIESGFAATIAQPQWRYSLGVGMVFLDGVLNFFGARVVPFDVSLGLEVGQIRYDTPENRLGFGPHIDFRGLFSKNFGLALTASPLIEKTKEQGSLFAADISIGIFLRLF